MITKYDATATLIEGDSGGGTRVSFYGTDNKGRLLKVSTHIDKLIQLVKAYDACQSTGHAAWHVEDNSPAPCLFCTQVRAGVEAQRAQIAYNQEWERTHDENGEVIK